MINRILRIYSDSEPWLRKKARYLVLFAISLLIITTPLPVLWYFIADIKTTIAGAIEVCLAWIVISIIIVYIKNGKYNTASNIAALCFCAVVVGGMIGDIYISPHQTMSAVAWLAVVNIAVCALFCCSSQPNST